MPKRLPTVDVDPRDGITAALAVDPAKPQDGEGVVKVDMNQVRTGIDKRDADMRSKQYLDTDVEANRWVTFQVTKVEILIERMPGGDRLALARLITQVETAPTRASLIQGRSGACCVRSAW